jgi:PAS domain S-box-containing protein
MAKSQNINSKSQPAQQPTTAEMHRRYEFIVNSSRDFNTLINRNYQYEAVNDAYCEAHGLKREDLIGRTVGEIWGDETFQNIIKSHLDSCFQGNEFHEEDWIKPRNFPKPAYFNINYYPYYGESHEVTHAIVVSRNITDRKLAELELAQLYDMQTKLFSSIAHSLKTPFSVILGNISMLKDKCKNRQQAELLEEIEKSINWSNEKISQMLKVAQLDVTASNSACEIISIDEHIQSLISPAIRLFQAYYPGLDPQSIPMFLTYLTESSAKIKVNVPQLNELILTILDNAFKHSPRTDDLPEVYIHTHADDNYVSIDIADRGIGIAPEHLSHIFDLHYQIDEEEGGFGIGLTLSKKLAEAMGGEITVESEVGKGTVFSIRFPV